MVWFVALVGILFLIRFNRGLARLDNPPKPIMFYDRNTDVVACWLNGIIGTVAIVLVVAHLMGFNVMVWFTNLLHTL